MKDKDLVNNSHICNNCNKTIFSFTQTNDNLFYCHLCSESLKNYINVKQIVTSSIPDLAKIYKFKRRITNER
jgi:transcription initiation factor IIE alpha subunit